MDKEPDAEKPSAWLFVAAIVIIVFAVVVVPVVVPVAGAVALGTIDSVPKLLGASFKGVAGLLGVVLNPLLKLLGVA